MWVLALIEASLNWFRKLWKGETINNEPSRNYKAKWIQPEIKAWKLPNWNADKWKMNNEIE